MLHADFRQTTCIATNFIRARLSHSNFWSSNLKYSTFFAADLITTNFAGANLYKADFSHSTITDSQLRSALSIQDAILPNGTLANDKNLIKNGEADCNISLAKDWILLRGTVVTSISDKGNGNCWFGLHSFTTGANMSQRVNLLDKWDSVSWPYSKAVLTAYMSTNVFLMLRGIDANGQIIMQTITSEFLYIKYC